MASMERICDICKKSLPPYVHPQYKLKKIFNIPFYDTGKKYRRVCPKCVDKVAEIAAMSSTLIIEEVQKMRGYQPTEKTNPLKSVPKGGSSGYKEDKNPNHTRRVKNDMNEKKKEEMILADTIQGEINRMCVTDKLFELDTMALHAKKNIEKLQSMRYSDIAEENEVREEQTKIEQLEHDILYEPTFSEEDGSM